jgi:hypothetical protein
MPEKSDQDQNLYVKCDSEEKSYASFHRYLLETGTDGVDSGIQDEFYSP